MKERKSRRFVSTIRIYCHECVSTRVVVQDDLTHAITVQYNITIVEVAPGRFHFCEPQPREATK